MTGLSGLLAKELIVDTHDHISPPQVASGYDLYDLIMNSYVAADVVSAAGSVLLEAEVGIGKKWRAYREFLPAVENTSYFRALFEGLGELYGVEVPPRNEDSFARLSERISEASRRPGWTREVFRRAKIEVALLDQFWNVGNTEIDRELFALVLRVDPFLCLHKADHDGNDASEMAAARGMSVESFGEYMKFVDFVCEENVKAGAVCFKIASAYERTLGFDEVSEGEARRIFEKREGAATEAEGVAFGDFVVHHIVGRAIEFGLPVQIHTGLQHGDGNVLSNSNPLLLARLFLKYPGARFDIFHGGYPFYDEAGCMAKNFPNAHLDMCWLPLISLRGAKRALHSWLDLVPANKLHWGGDTFTPEEAYGAARGARRVVSEVLEERVDEGELCWEAAARIGRMILRGNSEKFFRVKMGRQGSQAGESSE